MPTPPPPVPPPPQYVAYPRGAAVAYGSADRLEALGSGYFGLSACFALNILLSIGLAVVFQYSVELWGLGVICTLVGLTALIDRENAKIAYGKNWSAGMHIAATILMGLNSALCCGMVGYAVMQQIASSEMKKYGLRTGAMVGLRKKEWQASVARMRLEESGSVVAKPYDPSVTGRSGEGAE